MPVKKKKKVWKLIESTTYFLHIVNMNPKFFPAMSTTKCGF